MPVMAAASFAESLGTNICLNPNSLANSATKKAPLVWRNDPSNDNSPINNVLAGTSHCKVSLKMPTAIGKSYILPSLGTSAGAMLTVIFLAGKSMPQLAIAVRTRSLLSATALSANPTISKEGNPRLATLTSTSTWMVSNPTLAIECTFVSMDKILMDIYIVSREE